jgi:hypothetical protein
MENHESRIKEQGSALILVVGMLALMIAITVTFTIYMRTEQMAAGNFLSDVVARQYMRAALSQALADIEVSVGDDIYPSWDVLLSQGNGGGFSNALSGMITNWVPSGAFVQTVPAAVVPQWFTMGSVAGFKGEVAYVVLNCSGLLDANHAGGGTRAYGTSPSEIVLGDVTNMAGFVTARPYATQQELALRAGIRNPASSLVTYSAFPNSYDGGTNRGLVDISGDTNSLISKHKLITDAFKASVAGAGDADAEFFFNNLLDYVDDNDRPSALDSPCTERVPMANEVRARAFLANQGSDAPGGPDVWLSAVDIGIEWYYPFWAPPVGAYKMVVDVLVTNLGAAAMNKYVPNVPQLDNTISCVTNSCGVVGEGDSFSRVIAGPTTGDVVRLGAMVGVRVINSNGDVVDSVPYPYVTNNFLMLEFPQMTYPSVAGGSWVGRECIDPRFNWETSDERWVPYPDAEGVVGGGSMGVANKFSTHLRENNPDEYDLSPEMHVANAPLMNIGELGYLLRSREVLWSSCKLFADQRALPIDRFLDYYVVGSNSTRRGLLNVNSHCVAAWEDVFCQMPLDRYPGDPAAKTVDDLTAMAVAITNFTHLPLGRLSDIGLATNLISAAGLAEDPSVFRQRSVLRNISSLVDIRQQYFIVLLYGFPKKTKDRGEVADIQAVAEVWRDPLKRDDGMHPKIIHSFKVVEAW